MLVLDEEQSKKFREAYEASGLDLEKIIKAKENTKFVKTVADK